MPAADDGPINFVVQSNGLEPVVEQIKPRSRSSTTDLVIDTEVGLLIEVLLPLNLRANIDSVLTVSR